MAADTTTIVSTDIYKLTKFVENVKSRFMDIPDETLYLGMYGYLSSIFTNALENTAIMASEYANEAIPTKAKFERNVISHALALGIDKIYANPASIDVMICLPKDIIDASMTNDTFVLDKEAKFTIGQDQKYEFMLDFDVILKRNHLPNGTTAYSARYDMENSMNPIANYQNPYLPAIQVQEQVNTLFINIPVKLRQLDHVEVYKKILVNNPLETKVLSFEYENQLVYFWVEVSEINTTTGETVVHYLHPIYDGIYNDVTETKEFINYMFLDDHNIRLTFNRDSYQPRKNANVTIHIYTSLGSEANFTLQDTTYHKVGTISSERFGYNKLYYYLISLSDSIDGRDKLSVDSLRNIIPKEMLARGSITTYTDLNNVFNSVQTPDITIKFLKKVDNQVERLWYAYLLLRDSNSNIVPSNSITASFKRTLFSNTNKNNFILKPGTLFYTDPDSLKVSGVSDDITEAEKIKKDKASFLYMLPYLAVVTKSPLYVSYYMTYISYQRNLYFNYLNEKSLLQFMCLNYRFYREYFPSPDEGASISSSAYIRNTNEVYHLRVEAIQTLDAPFELFTYTATGGISTCNVKMFAVLYQKDDEGNEYPYRYMEGLVYSNDESTDGTSIMFEFKFRTNDVVSASGNYIYIQNGLKGIKTTTNSECYLAPNVSMKIFTVAKLDQSYGREYTINTKEYNLDDIIPGLSAWTLTNVYTTGEEGLDIYYDYSDMVNSYIELTLDKEDKEIVYTMYKVPVIRERYIYNLKQNERIYALNDIIDRRRKYIQSVLFLLEDSLGIDYKFFNTYGVSKFYNIEKKEHIDHINLTLKFEVKFVSKSEEALIKELTLSVKEYIEDLNNINDLHMPNLITYITNKYRNNIVYFKFIRLNNYESLYQSIYKDPELVADEFLDSQTVPEFINVGHDPDGNPEIEIDVVS